MAKPSHHFRPVGRVHLAKGDDLAHGLDVVADARGFAVDVADVAADGMAFFFQLLDALDETLEALRRNRPGLGLLRNGAAIGHVQHSLITSPGP